ncbi:Phenazine biosynthesis PhzF protein [Penicillium expansum]|uniref:Phenazine biosynthesis PhzF protein n=1 Tax=Penicillium expansum TaxID=27334 RepID=A0A0A2JE97_PENEN|nr:Phenazine biosynthesis PhzF protein [Penicillium expansum]KGO38543.1 Phenazine biosynthesis PhzF protein [Penicillium expansum]KGO40229.1 Phenazine biosynthesis PhzF protein [Penicillium expansum]KGO53008.1 Phenazine biosynthesis PhzF protein [Penicillium expansum]
MEDAQVHLLRVSPGGPDGDGTLLVMVSDKRMSNEEMQEVASNHDHIIGFAFPPRAGSDCDYEIHLWHPFYELDKCAHAMIGTVWLLSKLGKMSRNDLRIRSKNGRVEAMITKTADKDSTWVEFSYPICSVMEEVPQNHINAILSQLEIDGDDITPRIQVRNAGTNKIVKTMIPIISIAKLNELDLEYPLSKKLLEKIKSNGLCLYAADDHNPHEYEVRQIPKHAGDWEDTATALAIAIMLNGTIFDPNQRLKIRQRLDEDRYREMDLRFKLWGGNVVGCWIGGTAEFETEKGETRKTKYWETDTE